MAKERIRDQAKTVGYRPGPKYRRELMAISQRTVRELVLPWLGEEQAFASELYRGAVRRFVAAAEKCLRMLASSLDRPDPGSLAAAVLQDGQELSTTSEFYFHEMLRIAQPASPFLLIRDFLLGGTRLRAPFLAGAKKFAEELLFVNSSRVEHDLSERILTTRAQLEAQIRVHLSEILRRAETALEAAQGLLKTGRPAVDAEMERLSTLEKCCHDLVGEES